jgi:hypothetical protein
MLRTVGHESNGEVRQRQRRLCATVFVILASFTARNAASSFVTLAWLNLLSTLTIPIYIRMLGVSEWGLLAACARLQVRYPPCP